MGRKLNKVIGVLIIGIIFFMSTGYSVLNRELSISGDLTYRPKADIRITNITQKSVSNATIQYADFSKNEINIAYNAQTTSASVSFEIEITNYTDIKMGILKIDGLNGATIEGYNLKQALSNAKGPLTKGESATFTITFKASTTGIQQNLLTIYFEEICQVTYEGFSDTTNFKTEVIKGDSFSQNFGSNAPSKVEVTINGVISRNYVYSNNVLTISNVNGNIKIQALYTPVFIDSCEVHPNPPVLNGDMIPVVYDEYEKSWVKQDLDKSYDYCNQVWANAVTVAQIAYSKENLGNESVNLINEVYQKYKSTNQGKANKTSNLTLNFTAGSEGGILSFDYKVSSEKYDKLTLKVTIDGSTETLLNAVGEIQTGNYTKELSPNAEVTIVADYKKDPSGDKNEDTAYISNLSVPAGSTAISNNSTGDYPWLQEKKYYIGTTYETDDKAGNFILSETDGHDFNTDDIGKYICTDGSTTCTELYEITNVVGNTIKNVNKYSLEQFAARETYSKAPVGTPILMSAINTMWVWIPRYSYTIKKETNSTYYYGKQELGRTTIPTRNLPGEIDVKFISVNETDNTGSARYTGSTATDWRTNEAFNFPETDENGNNIPTSRAGIWVGKFETSWVGKFETGESIQTANQPCKNENCNVSNVLIKPNVDVDPNVGQTLSSLFYMTRSMQMNNADVFGFDKTKGDLHMMKNDEWGAVAYLSQSRYGKYGNSDYSGSNKEIYVNNRLITGISGGIPSLNMYGSYYEYDDMQELGQGKGRAGPGASTTGTIYGVYDMSGGDNEYVMGVIEYDEQGNNSHNGQLITALSGFKGLNSNGNSIGTIPLPNKKYYNTYKVVDFDGTTVEERMQLCYGEVCYGHALSETEGWYSDEYMFPSRSEPWFDRGGLGVFKHGVFSGVSHATCRSVLV